MHLEFIKREGLPEPYHGEFMFQYMNEEEIRMYLKILKKTINNFEYYAKIWLKNREDLLAQFL